MRFRTNFLIVPVIAAMLLTGCAGRGTPKARGGQTAAPDFSTASGDASKDLTVSVGAEDDVAVLKTIADNFKKDNPDFPYTVKPVVIGESDAKNRILSDVNSAPDVFTFADDQLSALAASGILTEVTDKNAKSDNLDAAVDAATIDKKMYAYPMTADNGYFLYYDKSFFDESDLKTLDGMMKKAAAAGKKITMDITSGWYLYSFYGKTGLKLGLADDGLTNVCDWNSTKNDPTGMDVANAIYDIAHNPGFETGGDDMLKAGAKDGSVVAGISGTWLSTDMQTAWGDNLGATKLPTYTCAGRQIQMASYAGYKMVGVNSFSAKKDWADEFAAYMTNEASQTLRFEKRGQGPSNKKAADSSEVKASVAIQALLAQSENSSLQRLGQRFWDPSFAFGTELVNGTKPTQKRLNDLVKQITAAVTE
jgi:arabinogalactan oligomer/maltooligosaccharide transport system substrate-binding protein